MWLAFTCWLQPHTCPLNFTCTTDEGVSEIHWAPDSARFLRCVMGTNQLLLGRLLQEDGESRLCLRRVAEDWSDSESSAREQAVTAWVTAAGERHSSRNRCVGPAQLASSCSSRCPAFFLLALPGCILHSCTLSSNICTTNSLYYVLSELPRVVSVFLLTVACIE